MLGPTELGLALAGQRLRLGTDVFRREPAPAAAKLAGAGETTGRDQAARLRTLGRGTGGFHVSTTDGMVGPEIGPRR